MIIIDIQHSLYHIHSIYRTINRITGKVGDNRVEFDKKRQVDDNRVEFDKLALAVVALVIKQKQ